MFSLNLTKWKFVASLEVNIGPRKHPSLRDHDQLPSRPLEGSLTEDEVNKDGIQIIDLFASIAKT